MRARHTTYNSWFFFLSFSLLGIPILVRRDRRLDMTLDLDFGSLDLLISREN